MAEDYGKHSRTELVRLLRARDAERRLGLVWESGDIVRERRREA